MVIACDEVHAVAKNSNLELACTTLEKSSFYGLRKI
jgi:hypothetical protein